MDVLWAKEKQVGYGVTVNIAASHVTEVGECFTASSTSVEGRGSSGFDSPYPKLFCLSTSQWPGGRGGSGFDSPSYPNSFQSFSMLNSQADETCRREGLLVYVRFHDKGNTDQNSTYTHSHTVLRHLEK